MPPVPFCNMRALSRFCKDAVIETASCHQAVEVLAGGMHGGGAKTLFLIPSFKLENPLCFVKI